jgi:hypothetical protein
MEHPTVEDMLHLRHHQRLTMGVVTMEILVITAMVPTIAESVASWSVSARDSRRSVSALSASDKEIGIQPPHLHRL